jgi:hypothetical protein
MESVTSNFQTMGESGIPHSVVNMSGQKSPYTLAQPRDAGGATHSDVPGVGTKANRSATLIREANGPRPNSIPLATRWPPNAACAHDVQRNVVPVPSALGNRDFWAKRAEGPVI